MTALPNPAPTPVADSSPTSSHISSHISSAFVSATMTQNPSELTHEPANDTAAPSAGLATDNPAPAPATAGAGAAAGDSENARRPGRAPQVQAVLEKLFELYPQLFGARFLPLKLGVFQELLAKHPEHFEKETLKAALGVHTRSTRYLQCVAAGNKRCDLSGEPVDDLAPEHVLAALLELHRRRQARSAEDLAPKLRAQIVRAFEGSGLSKQDYLARVQTKDEATNELLAQAFAQLDEQRAKQAALLRALDASDQSPEDFANAYGLPLRDVRAALAARTAAAKA